MGKKILLADDEEDILTLTASRLKKKGYTVITAVDGKEALEKIKSEKPDLVLLDYKMPGLTGIDVCHQLKADPALDKIPVVLFTASSESVKTPDLQDKAGYDDYLVKPFEAVELFEKIEKLIGAP